MSSRIYWLLLILILAIGVLLRIAPVLDNNFHFTMDQGDDAVNVREILERKQWPLHGSETAIPNVYSGVLWYYFLAVGYFLTQGSPSAVIYLLIFLTLVATVSLSLVTKKRVSPLASLVIAASLQIFWPFYDISRFGFNPFPLVPLGVITFLLLEDFWEKPKNQFTWATLTVAVSFHTELAGAMGLFLFYGVCGLWYLLVKKLDPKKLVLPVIIFIIFFIPFVLQEIKNDYLGVAAIQDQIFGSRGVFNDNRFQRVLEGILSNISIAAVPQNILLGLVLIGIVVVLFLKYHDHHINKFAFNFARLTLIFIVVNLIWFGSNTGWNPWHTASIPTLVFISLILIIMSLPRCFQIPLVVLVLAFQLSFFQNLYRHFINHIDDESILRNEISSIDWVYRKSHGQGFYVYNYLPSVRDYSHQYLFWWHGKKKYGYLPCEYSRYPGVPSFFVPGYRFYQNPGRPCSKLRFLIIEPDANKTIFNQWYQGVTTGSRLLESTLIGRIKVEERESDQ